MYLQLSHGNNPSGLNCCAMVKITILSWIALYSVNNYHMIENFGGKNFQQNSSQQNW